MGFTFVPLQSGAVSTWAQKQMAGIFFFWLLDGMPAYTYPNSSVDASVIPMESNSSHKSLLSSFCFSVVGWEVLVGSLCVSICTYRIKRSAMLSGFTCIIS